VAKVYSVHARPPKEKILAAAERIVRSEGAGKLSIRRVAARVQLTPMAIYRHFKSKDELIAGLVALGFERWEKRLRTAISGAPPSQRLRKLILAYRDFALEEQRLFELMFLTRRANVPVAPASLEATTSPAFSQVIAAVEQAASSGQLLSESVGDTILLVWATAHGLITLHFAGRFGYDNTRFRRAFERSVDLLLTAVKAKR
jgi:AcrR family transcriptional regulator